MSSPKIKPLVAGSNSAVDVKKRKREGKSKEDLWDIVWPYRNGLIGNPGECTVLLQIDPEDASTLDMEGVSGAIGRLEVDGDGGEPTLDVENCSST